LSRPPAAVRRPADAPTDAPGEVSESPATGLLARACQAGATVGVLLLLACAAVTVADVIARRTVGLSLPGLIDLSQLLVMTGVFLCIAQVFAQRANVEVDLVFERLPPGARRALGVAWALAAAGFLGAVCWHAGAAALQIHGYRERSPTLGWPMVLYWIPILIGCALAMLVSLRDALRPPPPHG